MKKNAQIGIALALALVIGVGGKVLIHLEQREHCDPSKGESKLTALKVDLPPGATLCSNSSDPSADGSGSYHFVVRASAVYIASFGLLGCPKRESVATSWALGMAERGQWTPNDKKALVSGIVERSLSNGERGVTLTASETTREGEVTGQLMVSGSSR